MGEHGVRLEEDFDEVSERLVRFFHVRNDSMASEPRQRLKRFVPRLPGTADDPDVERRRDYLCIDWVHRIATPAWLSHGL
jgi:hypothetical protein